MNDQRKTDAADYLKEVLRDAPHSLPRDVKALISQMILLAYLQGREDEARLCAPPNAGTP